MRLPRLPIRLLDSKFLTFLGNRIGKTLKVDATTIEQSRGRYAWLCVEVDLTKTLLLEYSIKTYCIEYESLHLICLKCGKYGHYVEECPEKQNQRETDNRGDKWRE